MRVRLFCCVVFWLSLSFFLSSASPDAYAQQGRRRRPSRRVTNPVAARPTPPADSSSTAPDARIIVVTYPQLLPDDRACPDRITIAPGDYAYVNEVNKALSDAVRDGALAGDAEYVDVYRASSGHDICSEEPWVNGNANDPTRAASYHPFEAEQQAVAKLILKML